MSLKLSRKPLSVTDPSVENTRRTSSKNTISGPSSPEYCNISPSKLSVEEFPRSKQYLQV